MNYSHPPIQEILQPAHCQFAAGLREFDSLSSRPPVARESLGRRHFALDLRQSGHEDVTNFSFPSVSVFFLVFFAVVFRGSTVTATAAPTRHIMSAQCLTHAYSSRPSQLFAEWTPFQRQNCMIAPPAGATHKRPKFLSDRVSLGTVGPPPTLPYPPPPPP